MNRTAWLVTAAVSLTACATQEQAFRPDLQAARDTDEGISTVEYDVDTRLGELADVRVWSRGAYEAEVRGGDATVLHVGLAVENEQGLPLAIDPSRLWAEVSFGDRRERVKPLAVEGATTIEPHGGTELQLHFELPGAAPDDVRGFRVHWNLQAAGRVHDEITPFVQQPEPLGEELEHRPYYDPFWYPYAPGPGLTQSPPRPRDGHAS